MTDLISREAAIEAVAPWEFDTDEGKAARRAAQDNIRDLPVWKPKGNYCVSAIAQNGITIGYRMRFVSAASEAEAIGLAIMAFKKREPDWSFCEAAALLVFADLTQGGATQAPAVKVRALEWILPPLGPKTAQTPWGRYSVSQWRDGWVWCWNGDYTVVETEEAAKAAAQADYAARILAAIEPAQGGE